jgi:hypothetical protein
MQIEKKEKFPRMVRKQGFIADVGIYAAVH